MPLQLLEQHCNACTNVITQFSLLILVQRLLTVYQGFMCEFLTHLYISYAQVNTKESNHETKWNKCSCECKDKSAQPAPKPTLWESFAWEGKMKEKISTEMMGEGEPIYEPIKIGID